ncbi:MAG: sigma-70 family RNA polymerase sigma factor [Steroidobacteraceae bacterium]
MDDRPISFTDAEIIAAVQSGGRDTVMAAVVPAFKRRVYGLAWTMLRDSDAAEEVAQDVFIKVWRALPGYDGRAAFPTWLYAIARNAAISALRRRRDWVSLSDEATLQQAEASLAAQQGGFGSAADASAGVRSAAELEAVDRALSELPDKQRQVVTLFYLQERSYDEVAALLAMPLGTVKTLLHRARGRLEQSLAPAREGVSP